MADADELIELLFFDTFSHEIHEDLNLDLVQFPKPVYITEVRIIPLGARVQADFPGGVRLGATNPSKFGIEFFVNDLGKPGASTFESLGNLEYNQNDCIHLDCQNDKIPTDGLVLRGWYTTITLAVYGTLTKNVAEQIASPPPPVEVVPEEVSPVVVQVPIIEPIIKEQPVEIREEVAIQPIAAVEVFEREVFQEPQFEANFEQPAYPDDAYYASSSQDAVREHDKRPPRRNSSERSNSRNRTYSRSDSNDREYAARQKREWSRSPEYRHSRRGRRDRSRDVPEHSERDHKWPRTPPAQLIGSPRRPRSPENVEHYSDIADDGDYKYRQKSKTSSQPIRVIGEAAATESHAVPDIAEDIQELPPIDDDTLSQDEQFEPILSDDEIGDDDNDDQDNEDMEIEDNDFEDAIKVYDPYKTAMSKFECDLYPLCVRDIDLIDKLLSKYELQTQIETVEDFLKSTGDEKENFVYISEQLLTHLQHVNQLSYQRRNFILKAAFDGHEYRRKLATNVLKVALSFDCACGQPQPGYKVRHIKIGARLPEYLGASKHFIGHFISVEFCDPFEGLFKLYEQDYMALSIKLMILKSIYALLDTKLAMAVFLTSKLNGYQRILTLLEGNPLTRAKFAIKSIIKKVHLYEALESVQDIVTKQFVLITSDIENPFETLECCLKEIKGALSSESMNYQQPKRFLPVSEKFEIVKDAASIRSWSHMLHSYFTTNALAESLLLIASNQNFVSPTLVDQTLELIELLVRSSTGLDYLVEDCFETTQVLVKCLLNIENYSVEELDVEKKPVPADDDVDLKEKPKEIIREIGRSQKLGVEVAYRVQTRYHIDAITYTKDGSDALVDHLHALYSQTCSYPGRIHTVDTLTSMSNNIGPLLHLIEKERKCQVQRLLDSPGVKYKSPILSYAVDLIDCCVRHSSDIGYLIEHEINLVELVKNNDIFESSVSAVLQEMGVYLKPLDSTSNFVYDDIGALCELIKRGLEYITTFPGDLIMALRILKHLGIADDSINYENQTKELKHRYVILQFYSADGIVTLLNVLEKLNTYFEQPGLHSAALTTSQAIQACQILLPALKILREMLTFVISCRDVHYKDITAIEHLLRTYALMHYYPDMSQAYDDAQAIKGEIIKTLLAYTQPNPQDQDSVHKSLWTQMIREVIKFILTTPSTFIPGLQAFAELLPLPLPVQTLFPLSELETQRFITERKLWSAHLHPQSSLLTEMIQTICPSSFPQLIDLLTRVCLQLADLAPNMTLLVSKTVIDLILNETSSIGSSSLARLLKFLGQLTAYASVKISSISILSGRLYEYFNQILINADQTEKHSDCQLNIHRIFENFFDSEISMITPNTTGNAELNLACALPSRELIPGIINAILINLFNSDVISEVAIAACRNLIILTEHDVTFYHLKIAIESKKTQFQEWLKKLSETKEPSIHRGLLGTVVLFLRAQMYIDESGTDSLIPLRTLKLTVNELASIIGWTIENATTHPLLKIKELFGKEDVDNLNNPFLLDLNNILASLEKVVEPHEVDKKPDTTDPVLPQAEGIVTQYLSRPIYTIYEPTDDPQLIADYWLEPIRMDVLPEEILAQAERTSCDLAEMVKTCLPADTNLSSECKRILHLSASPQSNRERATTAPCFRTRRVEVEPTTGRPEKKIFVTPMRGRGFPRTPPSRGDLFRSRPPNTSRPPSLHVDDFLALETCGAQPTGPTGYNKLSRDIISIRGTRVGRSRGSRLPSISSTGSYRTGSPSTWTHDSSVAPPPPQHYRTATSEPVVSSHFASDTHYSQPHFGGAPIRSRGRGRPRTFIR